MFLASLGQTSPGGGLVFCLRFPGAGQGEPLRSPPNTLPHMHRGSTLPCRKAETWGVVGGARQGVSLPWEQGARRQLEGCHKMHGLKVTHTNNDHHTPVSFVE